ncbi:ABC protein [Athelia psychrophila]|uniref:ABC protein n=1 Tax=Athelia psychrophila TaxID=1759441 RepID=A0A166F4W2_9AGAM|nr:ABC protein [Fibularhizoctonia sp. CBS 109695]
MSATINVKDDRESLSSTPKDFEEDPEKLKQPAAEPSPERNVNLQLDTGQEYVRFRDKFWKIWLPKDPPPPARDTLSDAPISPIATASFFSILTYSWITDIMVLGYQRTLQAGDLWRLDPSRECLHLSMTLDDAWASRERAAEEWNARLASGDVHPGVARRAWWAARALRGTGSYGQRRADIEQAWRELGGRKQASLAWALNDTFGMSFWSGGLFKVVGDTSQLMGPIIIQQIINFGTERYDAERSGKTPPSVSRGVGLAFAAFFSIIVTSVCQQQFFWRSMTTGALARAALIASLYKRGMRLTGRSRTHITNATLINHISTDVSRVDTCAQWFHAAWTTPIQVTLCLVILLVQLGPSALAGFSLFLFIVPLQRQIMSVQLRVRKASMQWTDKRAKLLVEVLGAMRVVKYFSYEIPLLDQIYEIRRKELKGVRKIQNIFSANLAFSISVPIFATTLAFVTYTSTTGHFDVAIIFSSLSLFKLLRQPLIFLPRALASISDARNALARLEIVFRAELITGDQIKIDTAQALALEVKGAVFEWEEMYVPQEEDKKTEGTKEKGAEEEPHAMRAPFKVEISDMRVPRGSLVAIVGPVGSGKSSLLQGLIGEMRRSAGHVSFGGRVSYCSQTAWIQNATLRNNILFGQPFEEDRYWQAVENACLLPDLDVLPDGDGTEIGEKGINLSGGQKQRVNIARALYSNADIVIMDDPLSAVDAHVGKALFDGAIIESLHNQGITVILVTHALHFLSQCDYIYTLKDGRIVERGTYKELVGNAGEFALLDKAYGGAEVLDDMTEDTVEDVMVSKLLKQDMTIETVKTTLGNSKLERRSGAGTGKIEGRLIAKEIRKTGSVSWHIYGSYIAAGRGWLTLPLITLFVVLMQTSQVMNAYSLVWWEDDTFHLSTSLYQTMYACLGISQSISTFAAGSAMDIMSYFASKNFHHRALHNIFYSPISFFDTTPSGRILSVLQKDIDTIDNQLPVALRLFMLTMSSVLGSVVIITILENYFILVVLAVGVFYVYFSGFYRASARELKRLDSTLRSILFAHFAESLTGLPTIRSYGAIDRFVNENKYYVDLEDRALFLTVTNQRWLAIRLDFLGAVMVFAVSLFAAVGVSNINPAQIGLVLTYTTTLSQMYGMVTRQTAEVDAYMNSVERVVQYSEPGQLDQEAPHETTGQAPPADWPARGAIEFKDVVMSYRPGLPKVLNHISVNIQCGEKIGIVGRTGAGKSSLMLALFRITELTSGSITIDGIDISTIGLKDLRSKISIIPQDPLLFSGTIRSNLDPFSLYTDAYLWDALHKSYLTTKAPDVDTEYEKSSEIPVSRYTLDTVIECEGANLSVGERSLLSLARALVKDSRVVIMDEATASVDLETDNKIQKTIQDLQGRTLLTIAHRLRTVISYDRILVLDAGMVVEFGAPLELFAKQGGIFRSMCEQSSISLEDFP